MPKDLVVKLFLMQIMSSMSDQIGKISNQKRDLKGHMSCYLIKVFTSAVETLKLRTVPVIGQTSML